MARKKGRWKKYVWESLSIFAAVLSAFALSNWNDSRQNKLSEQKILAEIENGIELDIGDLSGNLKGHELSMRANAVFVDYSLNKTVPQDSILIFYLALLRDYSAVINRSGYESLKASGMKTIKNDSLRFQIIKLYDFHYNIIEKLEDGIYEMQSFPNYFEPINGLLSEYMIFDEEGKFMGFQPKANLTDSEQKELLSYLWRLRNNRAFKMMRYEQVLKEMEQVRTNILLELE